jgi:hypothetical protein
MRRYAEGTTVSPEKSRMEVETFLRKKGASELGTMSSAQMFAIQFALKERVVRFIVPAPTVPKVGNARSRELSVERETRRRWRALLLVMKAKFEAVESGITTFDREFLAHLVAGDGRTVGDHLEPAIKNGKLAQGASTGWLALGPGGE